MVFQLQSYQVSLAFSIFSGGFGTGSFVNSFQGEALYTDEQIQARLDAGSLIEILSVEILSVEILPEERNGKEIQI
jgi:hypothetical protein